MPPPPQRVARRHLNTDQAAGALRYFGLIAVSEIAPPICISAGGFDRAKFHGGFNAAVVGFLGKTLAPQSGN